MVKAKPYNQDCPIARTLDLVGDRWTLLIIRDLFLGKSRFNEFRDSSPGIPPRLLSARLKRLEESGLIDRLVYSQYPLRAEYRLTTKGRSFFPVLYAMGSWGVSHLFDGEPELAESVAQFIESNVPEYRQMAEASRAREGGT